MNVLSLFDGMSCGQIALNQLGIKVNKYYASEIDKYAITIAKKNVSYFHLDSDLQSSEFEHRCLFTRNPCVFVPARNC